MVESKSSDALKEVFQKAADIAAVVPESMREAAFQRALDELLTTKPASSRGSKARSNQQNEPKESKQEQDWVQDLDRTKYPQVAAASTVLARALWILKVARDEFDVESLSPSDVSAVLKDKFRLPVSASQVSDKLGKAGNLVNRQKMGPGFVYTIMQPGEDELTSTNDPRPRSNTRRRKRASAAPKKVKATTGTNRKTPRGGRPGPKAMVAQLIDDSFFKEPKLVSHIIKHAQNSLGYSYKATDLSPALVRLIRDKKLQRAKNDEDQYEYTSA